MIHDSTECWICFPLVPAKELLYWKSGEELSLATLNPTFTPLHNQYLSMSATPCIDSLFPDSSLNSDVQSALS